MADLTVRASVLLLFSLARACAGGLQSWNDLAWTVTESARASWTIFGVARVRDRLSDPYDELAGAGVQAPVTSRVAIEGGYLFRRIDPDGTGSHDEHRFSIGPSLVLTRRVVTLRWHSLYERHLVLTDHKDFNRYRERIEIERVRRRLSPFLMTEVAFVREGLVRSRNRAGARWRLGGRLDLELAYQFESLRRGQTWIPRHAIRTSFHIGRRINGP